MEYRKFNDTYVIRMERSEEVMATLAAFCEKEDIRLASVEALGATDHAVVGIYDVATRVYHKQAFDEPMEISNLTGNVTRKDGQVYLHLHATLCDRNMLTHGGHVNELRISATCELFLRTLPGQVFRRLDEKETGLNLFSFQ